MKDLLILTILSYIKTSAKMLGKDSSTMKEDSSTFSIIGIKPSISFRNLTNPD